MRTILLVLSVTTCFLSHSQSIGSITQKMSDNLCECVTDTITSRDQVKAELNRCYTLLLSQFFTLADSSENEVLNRKGTADQVLKLILPTVKSTCNKVKVILEKDLNNTRDSLAQNDVISFPTNFSSSDLKNIKKLEKETIAFDGIVTEVHTSAYGKPYYQVKLEGGRTIWIASTVDSGFEKVGNVLRLLGFVMKVDNEPDADKHHKDDYHILVLCVIDMESKKMAMMPGSENQVKEWMDGKVPVSRK